MKPSPNKGRLQNRIGFETRDLSPPKCSIYLHQLFRFGFTVSSQLTCDVGLYRVSVRHLMGLGEKMSSSDHNPAGLSIIFAGFLSTVCHLPAVALASYCLS